jgi:hypothetical protein
MKTLKLLILTLFLSLTTFTNAQDASNDATWEDTIDFLNKNLTANKIEKKMFYFNNFERYVYDVSNITIDSKYLYVKGGININYRGGEDNREIKIPLLKLKSVRVDFLKVYLVSSAIKFKYDKVDWNFDEFYFEIDNDELEPRIIKAFQHLAFLATKKIKDAIKASGDKF